MQASPIILNLLVIRSPDIDRAVKFYQQLGITFDRHAHGKGPEHYAADIQGFIFEIYPQKNAGEITTNTRIGFSVADVDSVIEMLRLTGAMIVAAPTDTQWGRRAVVKDFDGHTVELVAPVDRNDLLTETCSVIK